MKLQGQKNQRFTEFVAFVSEKTAAGMRVAEAAAKYGRGRKTGRGHEV